ncbi:hypothetical protein CAEBREN_13162 [Caenorhabditis brenneri]|uniref:Protein pop-1 n=1 Tax=Caenorhabditis brenneri TaxID=135651 RepID=G0P0V4_CAEBE|nr:hypothetical protein CAEBREN_13162 [Caenorhabditis brenneri]
MADEELGDEVKVFRRDEDADDDPMISGETSEQQLADDKKEAVMEAELDGVGQISSIGELKASIKAEPSPSFPMMPGMIPTTAPFSPGYPLPYPAIMMPLFMPYGLRSPNLMLNMQALSPSFAMLPHSPSYLNMAMAAAAKQQLENQVPMHMGPLNPLSQMRMPPYMPQGIVPQNNDRRGYGGGKVKKEDHIKKPLNAFMWFMKENRKALLEEIGNNEKQSAELNKELGKRWHDLPKEEQQKYFEMAKKDRETHKEKYPQWSARENYAVNKKKTKKRRDKSVVLTSENSDQKKCRARFGVNNTEMWCKFCKRKKKCEYATDRSGSDMTDNLDGRGTSGACSSSSGSPSPSGNMGLPSLAQQQLRRTFEMHALINNMPLGSTSTLVSSPQPSSSAGRSPQDTNVSDSESDIDEDEEIDPTILHQTDVVLREETMCTL